MKVFFASFEVQTNKGNNITPAHDSLRTQENPLPAVRVTPDDAHYFFAYFDKCPWSGDERYLLAHRAEFHGRAPTAEDRLDVGVIDLKDGKKYRPLGETRAWNWQMGCQLQWSPGGTPNTYPDPETQERMLILYRLRDGTRFNIGRFRHDPAVTGPFRCDLHPRWNRDGQQICFDSIHEGFRGVYLADVSEFRRRND